MQPSLEPQLADLLSTLIHPPDLLLRVAAITPTKVNKVGRHASSRATIRYLLSDGELMIQAILHANCDRSVIDHEACIDDYIEIRSFEIKKARRTSGLGHVVYLLISDCHWILPHGLYDNGKSRSARLNRMRSALTEENDTGVRASGPAQSAMPDGTFLRKRARFSEDRIEVHADEHTEFSSNPPSPTPKKVKSARNTFGRSKKRRDDTGTSHIEQDGDDFQEVTANQLALTQRRRALRSLDLNILSQSSRSGGVTSSGKKRFFEDYAESLPSTQTDVEAEPVPAADHPNIPEIPVHPAMREQPQVPRDSLLYQVRDATFTFSQPERARQLLSRPPSRPATSHGPAPINTTNAITTSSESKLLPAPPFHTLRSLRHPPSSDSLPSKNYMLTTLAVVTWTSPGLIQKANSPWPAKRHIKIVDPSLSSRPTSRTGERVESSSVSQAFRPQNIFQEAVTVANYIDAMELQPVVGTIVLLRGLVMQRLPNGDVILNAYGRLNEQRFQDRDGTAGEDAMESVISHNEGPDSSDAFSHWFVTDASRIQALGYGRELEFCQQWWDAKRNAGLIQG